jgi:hypothetical protein
MAAAGTAGRQFARSRATSLASAPQPRTSSAMIVSLNAAWTR